ncbi:hypothetical protein RB599_000571 [Gaeumannomyces hyphopodioides]
MLYSKNARVCLLARSGDKTQQAIRDIQKIVPSSAGSLQYLRLDLGDLAGIEGTVQAFQAKESKLHVLFNNASVLSSESKVVTTKQGYEYPKSRHTVRVVWIASSSAELFAQKDVGITADMIRMDRLAAKSGNERYWISKVGNWAHGVDRICTAIRAIGMRLAVKLIMYPPVNGAYTELYAGLSPEVKIETTGCWVVLFGRIFPIWKDLNNAVKSEAEGGTGGTKKFWKWTEDQVCPYL